MTRSQVNALKRTVLITGASGFIGKHLVRTLAASGAVVRAASRDPEAIPARSSVERVPLPDFARPADWSKLTEGVTQLVHLAGISHAPGTLPDEVYTRINTDVVGELATRSAIARRIHDSYVSFRERASAWSRISMRAVLEAREG